MQIVARLAVFDKILAQMNAEGEFTSGTELSPSPLANDSFDYLRVVITVFCRAEMAEPQKQDQIGEPSTVIGGHHGSHSD